MTNNNPFLRFIEENNMASFMSKARQNAPDWQALFEMQRKNAQAWSQATQIATKNIRNIAEMNRKAMAQITKDNAELMRKMISNNPPEKQIEENSKAIKNWIEKSAENTQKASSLLKKAQEQSSEILNERLNQSMDELKSCMINDNSQQSDESEEAA